MRNILRRARVRGVVATVLAGGLVLGVGPAANAVTTAEAAAVWKAHDKNCEDVPGPAGLLGTVCVQVQKRVTDAGAVTGYRGRVSLAPEPGQALTPDHYVWNSEIIKYCASACTPKTSAWTSSWSPVLTSLSTYVAWSPKEGSNWDVGAGWSEWFKQAGRCVQYSAGEVCVNRYQRGYHKHHQERGQLVVKPVAGQWIEPRWVRVGRPVNGENLATTKDLCAPVCTKRSTNYSSSVVTRISGHGEDFASASWMLPSGAVKSMRVAE